MEKFAEATLKNIADLEFYLFQCLSDGSNANFHSRGDHEDKLSHIQVFVESFISTIDLKQHHKLGQYFNEYKRGEHSLHMVMGYKRQELLLLLGEYKAEYLNDAKSRLFPMRVSDMTGKDVNEFLQLIGILK